MKKIKRLNLLLFGLLLMSGVFFDTEKIQASVDYNCYCLDGSIIPFYYPDNKKINTSDFDTCHQECANAGAKYFSFSTVAHAGTTKVTKSSIIGQNPNTVPSGETGSAGQITDNKIPGTVTEESELVTCGRAGQRMCTLCDFIAGLNNVIQYLMKISIGVGILAFTIAGVMYIVSAGDTKMIGRAKDTMKNAAIGFVIIFAGWVIINTVIQSLGSKTDAQGNPTFGMNIRSWGQFECGANPNR